MSTPLRLSLAAVLLAAVVGTGWALTAGPAGDVHADRLETAGGAVAADAAFVPARFTSSAQCKDCHAEVWDEWHGSQHQISYQNPAVRMLSNDFRTKECQACHLPKPVYETGLVQRTLPRVTRPHEGVGCLSCHEGPDGRVVARHTMPDAPCTPIAREDFVAIALCETCHNQHGTTDEWRASPFAVGDGMQSCTDCHMPEVERADGSRGRSHVMPGGHDLASLRAAGTFEVTAADDELLVRLTNTGCGHNYPTEERSRALDMIVRFIDAHGEVLPVPDELVEGDDVEITDNVPGPPAGWRRIYRFRNPYRDEPLPNTQLPSGESREQRVAIPQGAVAAEARLVYRRNPYAPDDDPEVVLVEERRVELE